MNYGILDRSDQGPGQEWIAGSIDCGGVARENAEVHVREGDGALVQVAASTSRYQLETALGVGGMGEVYRGVDTVLGRRVAIKFLTRQSSTDSISERILHEARSASALSHPNVCTVY